VFPRCRPCFGESVSLRLLRGKAEFIGFKELGMGQRDSEIIQQTSSVLTASSSSPPDGIRESTSLYAFLHEINTIDDRIITAEERLSTRCRA